MKKRGYMKKVKGMRDGAERMKADLTLGDRFAILGILPIEGNFATLKIVRKLREQLSLIEAEIKKYHVIEVREGDRIVIQNAKTDAEALTIATKIFGVVDAQRMALGIRNGTFRSGQITWNNGEKTTEMEFGEFAEKLIKDELKKLNDANPPKLEDRHFAIYEKFVEGMK